MGSEDPSELHFAVTARQMLHELNMKDSYYRTFARRYEGLDIQTRFSELTDHIRLLAQQINFAESQRLHRLQLEGQNVSETAVEDGNRGGTMPPASPVSDNTIVPMTRSSSQCTIRRGRSRHRSSSTNDGPTEIIPTSRGRADVESGGVRELSVPTMPSQVLSMPNGGSRDALKGRRKAKKSTQRANSTGNNDNAKKDRKRLRTSKKSDIVDQNGSSAAIDDLPASCAGEYNSENRLPAHVSRKKEEEIERLFTANEATATDSVLVSANPTRSDKTPRITTATSAAVAVAVPRRSVRCHRPEPEKGPVRHRSASEDINSVATRPNDCLPAPSTDIFDSIESPLFTPPSTARRGRGLYSHIARTGSGTHTMKAIAPFRPRSASTSFEHFPALHQTPLTSIQARTTTSRAWSDVLRASTPTQSESWTDVSSHGGSSLSESSPKTIDTPTKELVSAEEDTTEVEKKLDPGSVVTTVSNEEDTGWQVVEKKERYKGQFKDKYIANIWQK